MTTAIDIFVIALAVIILCFLSLAAWIEIFVPKRKTNTSERRKSILKILMNTNPGIFSDKFCNEMLCSGYFRGVEDSNGNIYFIWNDWMLKKSTDETLENIHDYIQNPIHLRSSTYPST